VGVKNRLLIPVALLLVTVTGTLSAAPKLRLSGTAIGPLVVATGTNPDPQSVEAFNAGDGELSLSVTSNAPWLVAGLGEPVDCSLRAGLCTSVQMSMDTAGLEKGTYTALVTVSDPNALDAPQTISVTVKVGGAVPDQLSFHVTPGGTREYLIKAANPLGIITGTVSGGSWLSVPSDGGGSFRFTFNYKIVAAAPAELGEGTYDGTLNVINSRISDENKVVPVTLTVTRGPILSVPEEINLRLAEGGPLYTRQLRLINRGGSTLAASEVHVATDNGGEWLTAELINDGTALSLHVQPAGLGQEMFTGSLEIVSNASNSTVKIPVHLEILPAGLPVLNYGAITSVADPSADVPLAKGMLARLRGSRFTAEETASASVPYPDTLAGTRVLLNGNPVPLAIVSADEIWMVVPYNIDAGEAILQVERAGEAGNQVAVTIDERAPVIERSGVADYANAVLDDGVAVKPEVLGGRPAITGDTVTIYLTGLGVTIQEVENGTAPDPGAEVAVPVKVSFGGSLFMEGAVMDATSAVLVPGSPGRYAVKVVVPDNAPRGDAVNITVSTGDAVSNKLQIAIQ
jgi:uncharacterized protein (TIGR03437 family)